MSQHTGSHKNSLNFLGEKYLNESHWPMRRIGLLECTSGTFTQSDQSFRCPPEDGLGTELPIKCMAKILIIGLDKMLR